MTRTLKLTSQLLGKVLWGLSWPHRVSARNSDSCPNQKNCCHSSGVATIQFAALRRSYGRKLGNHDPITNPRRKQAGPEYLGQRQDGETSTCTDGTEQLLVPQPELPRETGNQRFRPAPSGWCQAGYGHTAGVTSPALRDLMHIQGQTATS